MPFQMTSCGTFASLAMLATLTISSTSGCGILRSGILGIFLGYLLEYWGGCVRVPSRVLTRNVVLRDDGKRLGLHPRGQAWQREDGGTTGGWREDGRQRMTDDSRRRTTAPQLRWVQHWGLRDVGRERMVLLVKCTRRCIKEEEGSGEKASIYMILVLTLAPRATPTRHTPVDHHYRILAISIAL